MPQLPYDGSDYRAVNKAMWDGRAPAHAASADYAVERFVADPGFLSDVVRFDVPLLGDVAGLRGLHLQCHIGTDTISLARLGARMTGLDLSSVSLAQAREIAAKAGADVEFVESEVYAARDVLEGEFDLVFTGIGALCWLPSIERWAETVASLLAPGGRLFLREGHPMAWTLEDEGPADAPLTIRYPYFETDEPTVWEDGETYVETDAEFTDNTSMSWNHGLGEIVSALLGQGLRLTGLVEHRSVPWEAVPGRMERGDDGEFRLREGADLLPLSYTLQATKP